MCETMVSETSFSVDNICKTLLVYSEETLDDIFFCENAISGHVEDIYRNHGFAFKNLLQFHLRAILLGKTTQIYAF